MAQVHSVKTTKTARVFTHGSLTAKTKLVWIVAHGYGFLAEYFIKKFEELNPEEHFVIVPEALNRFYLKELSGRVGASWMTTEDRENEISDYVLYLDNVYETLISQTNAKIVAFGFSQGAATMARWSVTTSKPLNRIVFWGGSIPNDCFSHVAKLNALHPCILVGDEDEFIPKEKLDEVMKGFINTGLTFSHIFYKGGHAILTQPLMQLSAALTES
jgi:predicted esterase